MKNLKKKVMLSLLLGSMMGYTYVVQAEEVTQTPPLAYTSGDTCINGNLTLNGTIDSSSEHYALKVYGYGTILTIMDTTLGSTGGGTSGDTPSIDAGGSAAGNVKMKVTFNDGTAYGTDYGILADNGAFINLTGKSNSIDVEKINAGTSLDAIRVDRGSRVNWGGGTIVIDSPNYGSTGTDADAPTASANTGAAHGALVTGESLFEINGYTKFKVDSDSHSKKVYGLLAKDNGTLVNINDGLEVKVASQSAELVHGIEAAGGAKVNINSDVVLISNGTSSSMEAGGFGASNRSVINLASGAMAKIHTSGGTSFGVRADVGSIANLDGSVSIAETNPVGNSYGVYAGAKSNITSNGTISVKAEDSNDFAYNPDNINSKFYAICAYDKSELALNNKVIVDMNKNYSRGNLMGISGFYGSTINVADADITLNMALADRTGSTEQDTQVRALYQTGGGTMDVKNVKATLTSKNNKETTFLYNAGGEGVVNLNNGGTVTINSVADSDAGISYGILAKYFDGKGATVEVKGGTLDMTINGQGWTNGLAADGNNTAINVAEGANLVINLQGATTPYASNGLAAQKGGSITVDGAATITSNQQVMYVTDKAGDAGSVDSTSGLGDAKIIVNKNGGKTMKLTGNVIAEGNGKNVIDALLDDANSFLTGASKVAGNAAFNLKLENDAVWNMTADSQVSELFNDSLVNMRYSGNDKYETLTIGTLSSGGTGTFEMDTDLQKSYDTKNVMGAGDKIIINEASSGNYVLNIRDASLNTNKKAEGYLLLVRDYSGGSATFTGGTLERGGIFKYKPIITSVEPGETDYAADYAVPDTVTTTAENGGAAGIATYSTVATPTVKNWYLTGYANPLDPVDPDDGNQGGQGGDGDQGGQGGDGDQGGSVDPQPVDPADYLSNNAKFSIDLAHSRYVNYLMDHDTLLKRLGELRMVQQNKDEDNDGIWARFRKGSMTTDTLDGDFKTYQLGYDKEITPQRRYVGAAISHTDSSYDGSAASAEGNTTAFSIYNTWLGEKNHYLDLVAKAGRMHGDSTYNHSRYAEKGSYKTMFYSLSAEYGRKNINEDGFYYEPQAQLTLGRINGDNYVTSLGTEVQQDAVNSVLGRVGVTFGKEFNMDKPEKHSNIYAKVNVLHEFAGDSKVTLADTDGDSFTASKDYGGTWLNVGVGATANIGKATNLYMDFEKNFGGEVKSNWIGQVGLRVSF